MSRLRVRNTANTKWIDICQSEWYVRNPSNTGWERFTPKQGIKARHGAENYWLSIDCIAEGVEDCEADEYGGTKDGTGSNGSGAANGDQSGNPQPGDGTGGSGSGSGSGGSGSGPNSSTSPLYNNGDLGSGNGGTGWTSGAPYPDGYDLPDSDGDGAGWNGSCYYRPGLNTCEAKTPLVVRDDMDCGTYGAGSFNCPFVCPDSVIGNGAGISEFYLDMGKVSGKVTLPWSANPGAASFDVYYRGKIVASTAGKRGGTGSLQFVFSPVDNDSIVFVRVRSTATNTRWTFQVKCVGDDDTDGDITDPRPCHGTYEPKNGGQGVYEYFHNLGTTAGVADIHYQMWNQPDRMDVYNNQGQLIQTTGGYVAGEGHLKINHVPGGDNTIRVRVTARDPGTSWVYLITCPGQKGSEDNPRPCSDGSAVTSGGAGVTDTYVDFGDTAGRIGIRYQMYEIPDKLDVYQNGTLVATTGTPVTGDHWMYFNYNPAGGRSCHIRVTGSGKTSWSFLHTCPLVDVKATINNPSVKESNDGQTAQLCFTITLDKAVEASVPIDYTSTAATGALATSGTVTFAPGETSKNVCVTIRGDSINNGNRTVTMTISSGIATITAPTGVGTIIDDDSTLCNQNPQAPVYEFTGGPDGSYALHVQPDKNCAAGNTKYLMMMTFNFPASGAYVFNNLNDDDFELYIDCVLVASGPIGSKITTVNVNAGPRQVILRYLNVPNCTPGYAAFSMRLNNQLVYITRAADWKGQANSIGEIEGGSASSEVVPPTCNSTPEICQVYRESFARLPDEAGAQYWLQQISANGWDVKTPAGYAAFKLFVREHSGADDCAITGGTYDAAGAAAGGKSCIL